MLKKRLLLTIILAVAALLNAIIPVVLTYDISNTQPFPWRTVLLNPFAILFIVIDIIYNSVYKMIDCKTKKSVDDEVIKEVKKKNYELLYNHHIKQVIKRNNPGEIKEELKRLEKGLV